MSSGLSLNFARVVGHFQARFFRLRWGSDEARDRFLTFCCRFAVTEESNNADAVTNHSIVGLIRPGGTVVEGTAGNTGIGLAHMCLAMGYKCVIFMPNNQSRVSTLINLISSRAG